MYRYTKLSLLAIAIATTAAVAYAAKGGIENDALTINKPKFHFLRPPRLLSSISTVRLPALNTKIQSKVGPMTLKSLTALKFLMSALMPTKARSFPPLRIKRITMMTMISKTDPLPA
jgi:hypothetical protein